MTTLQFRFRDIEAEEPRQTSRTLSVLFNGAVIWPVRGVDDAALEIQIDDILSHLTEFWKPLMLRQTFPLALDPMRPSQLRAKAEENWASLPEDRAEEEDQILDRFQECHDLSRCFAGYFDLPPLWLIRSGKEMLIDSTGRCERADFEIVRDALQAAGDWIADQLVNDRWSDLIAAWRTRDAGDGVKLLYWSTSLDVASVTLFAAEGLLAPPKNVTEAASDDDELRVAARMASALPQAHIKAILERVKRLPKTDAPDLDDLVNVARTFLAEEWADAWPFEQGVELAKWARKRLHIAEDTEVDVFAVVRALGIQVHTEAFDLPALDALAIWGRTYGPATLLNATSLRHGGSGPENAEDRGQVRVTLAHELCHFLIDRGHALGAVDILRSRMPAAIEQRARAFAGEFLLTSNAAADAWFAANRPRDEHGLEHLLGELCRRFAISKSVASWKLQHGIGAQNVDIAPMLDAIVPRR